MTGIIPENSRRETPVSHFPIDRWWFEPVVHGHRGQESVETNGRSMNRHGAPAAWMGV